ncbi:MAG: ABC transporter ATP-binding protein [Oligoflexales bacterium]
MTNAVEVSNLNFLYKTAKTHALNNFNLNIPTGSFFALLGPNGAGKTTFLNLLAGLIKKQNSGIKVFGKNIESANFDKRKIGYVPQDIALYLTLTAEQNLRFFAKLAKVKNIKTKIDEVLETVSLSGSRRKAVMQFSGGMKRRLNLAVALLGDPELLILDEPTTGVDQQSRRLIFDKLLELKQKGLTLVYTSHYLEEVEKLCDRIAIMDHGRILVDTDKQSLLHEYSKNKDSLEEVFANLTGPSLRDR